MPVNLWQLLQIKFGMFQLANSNFIYIVMYNYFNI